MRDVTTYHAPQKAFKMTHEREKKTRVQVCSRIQNDETNG